MAPASAADLRGRAWPAGLPLPLPLPLQRAAVHHDCQKHSRGGLGAKGAQVMLQHGLADDLVDLLHALLQHERGAVLQEDDKRAKELQRGRLRILASCR